LRIVAVSALTAIALPLLLNENRDEAEQRPPAVAAVGISGLGTGDAGGPAPTSPSDPSTTAPPASSTTNGGYLSGATTSQGPYVIDVAVRAPKPTESATGKAGFRRWAPGLFSAANPCATALAPIGVTITLTNLDNGHSTTCVNVGNQGIAKGTDIVVQSEYFEQLADLVQAPVPVELRW
jgi:hypothetical protein